MTVGSGRISQMNPPRPQESRWISRSRRHDTKLPVDNFVRYFNTEALGAVVLVGGLYGMSVDMVTGSRVLRMTEFECNDEADWYWLPVMVAWSESRVLSEVEPTMEGEREDLDSVSWSSMGRRLGGGTSSDSELIQLASTWAHNLMEC